MHNTTDFNCTYSDIGLTLTVTSVSLVILDIIAANAFAFYVFTSNRRLRQRRSNWFLISLTVADFLVGTCIMPFTLAKEVLCYWPFGTVACEAWLAADVFLCTASILHICMIGLDRYWTLKDPIAYGRHRPRHVIGSMIAGAWISAGLIAFPPLVGWRATALRGESTCELSQDRAYVLYSAGGSFYIPVLLMMGVYIEIFRITRRRNCQMRSRLSARRQTIQSADVERLCATLQVADHGSHIARLWAAHNAHMVTKTAALLGNECHNLGDRRKSDTSPSDINDNSNSVIIDLPTTTDPTRIRVSICSADTGRNSLVSIADDEILQAMAGGDELDLPLDEFISLQCSPISNNSPESASPAASLLQPDSVYAKISQIDNSYAQRIKRLQLRERKSALMLGSILLAFILCWGPFFVLYVIQAYNHTVPELLFDICFFLGYCNSAMNPVIYGLFNRDIRRTLVAALCCCCPKMREKSSLRRIVATSERRTSMFGCMSRSV